MPPGLSIVIVSWNTKQLLSRCLESISGQEGFSMPGEVEIILVDNASTDGSVEMVREQFPDVVVIENARNNGFAAANNQGLRIARGKFLLLLNPDTELPAQALRTLLEVITRQTGAGAVGAGLINPDGTLQQSASPMIGLWREAWRLFHLDRFYPLAVYPLAEWDQTTEHPVDVVQGACLMLKRTAVEQVGLLDEDYFIYTEEVDMCFRLKEAGFGIYWVPQVRVLHYGGQSTRQRRREMFLKLYESKVIFFRKHFSRTTVNAYKLLLGFAALLRLVISPVSSVLRRLGKMDTPPTGPYYWYLLRILPGL